MLQPRGISFKFQLLFHFFILALYFNACLKCIIAVSSLSEYCVYMHAPFSCYKVQICIFKFEVGINYTHDIMTYSVVCIFLSLQVLAAGESLGYTVINYAFVKYLKKPRQTGPGLRAWQLYILIIVYFTLKSCNSKMK